MNSGESNQLVEENFRQSQSWYFLQASGLKRCLVGNLNRMYSRGMSNIAQLDTKRARELVSR
jgi:hypothetical protein